jgi:hypothetical protein
MVYKGQQVKIDNSKVEDTLKNLVLPGFGNSDSGSSGGLPGFNPPGLTPPALNPPGLNPPGLNPPKP